VYRLDVNGAWRMTVRVKQLDRNQPTELRGFLQSGDDVLSETWSNILPPLLQR
jgi:periplasmic glucans biosynthesis protein